MVACRRRHARQSGRAVGFDRLAQHVGEEMAYLVEVERFEAKMGGRAGVSPVSLRCTSIFRREDGDWRLVHRHADPITGARGAESVIQEEV